MTAASDRRAGLRTRIVAVIREHIGLHEQFSVPIADEIVTAFHDEFAGEKMYLGGRDPDRDAKVLADFNGRNHEEVMERHVISRSTLYNILQRGKPKLPES